MPELTIVGPEDGEQVRLGPIRMRIIEDGETTDHRLGAGIITVPPHTDGPPQHWHDQHDEGFYVLSGTATFTTGETIHEVPAGGFVMVPPKTAHTFSNASDEAAVILNTFTPDFYVNYFRELRQMAASGTPLTPADVVELMARYHTYPAGQPATQPAA